MSRQWELQLLRRGKGLCSVAGCRRSLPKAEGDVLPWFCEWHRENRRVAQRLRREREGGK